MRRSAACVLAGHFGQVALLAPVVVILVQLFKLLALASRQSLFSLFELVLRGFFQALRGIFGFLVLGPRFKLLEAILFHASGDASRAQHGGRRVDEKALRAERIKEFPIVAHEQPDALVAFERGDEHVARVCVNMVRGFVESEHLGVIPHHHCDLHAFAFAVAQRVPAVEPIFPYTELLLESKRCDVFGHPEIIHPFRGGVRALDGVAACG